MQLVRGKAQASVTGLIALACLALGGDLQAEPPPPEPQASEPQSSEPEVAEPEAASEAAGEEQPAAAEKRSFEERVRVVGSAARAREATGSKHFIGEEELARQGHSDVQRVLRAVPGVNLQDEEGYGLRPNIGFRGTGVERSQKVTLMEDGVLIAPAPYAAPSAYYFPSVARMEAVEVSKGPASIRQGPNTTGGVLNLVSHSIPDDFSGELELAGGSDASGRGKLRAGESGEQFDWLVETFQEQTGGFKRLDGGGDTGFDISDWLTKIRVHAAEGAPFYQSLELKLGATDQSGDETYLGLTREDFERTPHRRYVASSEDHITTDHEQAQLRWVVVPRSTIDVTTTVYHNDFYRNWHKLETVGGEPVADILADPDDPTLAGLIEIVRGEADSAPGELAIRNNRRDYDSGGVQSALGWRVEAGATRQEIEVGLRYHQDEEDRFQENDGYQMLDGSLVLTAPGAPGSQANRVTEARAVALFVRDAIQAGRWRIEPGVRFETVDFAVRNYGTSDPQRTGVDLQIDRNDVSEVIPGVGATFTISRRFSLLGGVHEGFAPPGPGQDEAVDPERSVAYELGARLDDACTHAQAVAFFSDYENLLGTDTTSGGGQGTGDQFNGGAVEVDGLELSLDHDCARPGAGDLSLPFRFAYTLTRGDFRTSFETAFEDWAPAVARGDELPYVPAHQLFAEMGWQRGRWGVFGSASWVSEMRTNAGQGAIPEEESIEERWVFDATGNLRIGERFRAFLQVRNVTDEVYVAARRPAGLRPGLPRTMLAGFGARF